MPATPRQPVLAVAEAEAILRRAAPLSARARALDALPPEDVGLTPAEAHRHGTWERMISVDGRAGDAALERFYGSPERRRALFSGAALAALPPDPEAAGALVALVAAMVRPAGPRRGFLRPDVPLPFEELFAGPVGDALDRLKQRFAAGNPDPRPSVQAEAWDDLGRDLLRRLTRLASEPLYRSFSVWRRRAEAEGIGHDALYPRFVETAAAATIRSVLETFPVLGRLFLTIVRQWDGNAIEALTRLQQDREAIERLFGRPLAPLARMRLLGSDPHRDGRCGFRLDFADGFALAGKPRTLAMEAGWFDLLAQLRAAGAPAVPSAARALDRGDHGWMEWLESPGDETDIPDFARSLGGMLCLAHLLDGTDLHFENILATRTGPAAIDLETLFHPRGTLKDEDHLLTSGTSIGGNPVRQTVIWTHLLPSWVTIRNRDDIGLGGINAADEVQRGVPRLVNINTGSMRCAATPRREAGRANLPHPLRDPKRLSAAAPDIVAGFSEMWDFIAAHRDAARLPDRFRRAVARVILRPTEVYSLLLRRAMAAQSLVDGAAWSGQFDYLLRFVDVAALPRRTEVILHAERRAMERLDIPFFRCAASGVDLIGDDTPILPRAFRRSALDAVTARLAAMTTADRAHQVALIEATLAANDSRPVEGAAHPAPPVPTRDEPTPDRLVAAAEEIGRSLLAGSIDGQGGGWLALMPTRGYGFAQIEVTRPDFYAGGLGMAVFFADLAETTGDAAWAKGAARAAAPAETVLADPVLRARLISVGGFGLGGGLAGMVYGFGRLARALKADRWRELALVAARAMADNEEPPGRSDILDGTAGAVIALLGLDRAEDTPWLLAAAADAGDRLLAGGQVMGQDMLVWPSLRDRALAGMAHGAAGIALALALLGARTGRREFTEAAQQALRFERSVFDPDRRAWPDLRAGAPGGTPDRPPVLNRWCHGAAGIGLARLAMPGAADAPAVMAEIETALEATRPALNESLDGLCCGNFGRIEFLSVAGHALHRQDLVQEALAAAAARLHERRQRGRFRWAGGNDSLNVGLFTGTAGIGHQLLRLARPEAIPSVLQWR